MTNKRAKSWTFILYPESALENWREILESMEVEWVESPLHDQDLTERGEPKKSHYHILLLFDTLKSYTQVLELTKEIKATIPQKCSNVKSLIRYMAHLDNPEKHLYPKEEVKAHGNIELEGFFETATTKRCEKLKEIIEFLLETGITEFEDLVTYAMKYRFIDWFPLLCSSNATPIHMFLKSRRHRTNAYGGWGKGKA